MLSYKTEGIGPPLLLIHGFGISFPIWKELAPLLAPHFHLIQIELPGIGQSPMLPADQPYLQGCALEIEQLCRALGHERWSIMSYSSGTRAAAHYIRQHSAQVERALFLCPAYITEWRRYGLQLLSGFDARMPSFGAWLLSGWRLRMLVRGLGFNGRNLPAVKEWTEIISSQPLDTLRATLYSLRSPGRVLFDLPVPALYLWGAQDVVFPAPCCLQGKPNHRMIQANHSAPQFAAPAIAEIAIPFLQQVSR